MCTCLGETDIKHFFLAVRAVVCTQLDVFFLVSEHVLPPGSGVMIQTHPAHGGHLKNASCGRNMDCTYQST